MEREFTVNLLIDMESSANDFTLHELCTLSYSVSHSSEWPHGGEVLCSR